MRSFSPLIGAACLVFAGCGGSGSSTTGPASSLSISIATNPIKSGTSVQASATTVTGSGSSPASNVSWSSSNEQVASISSSGLITGAHQGTSTIRATSGGLTGQVVVTVVPGAPASIVIYAGNGQSAARGSAVADPLCTNVKDAAGNLIIGFTVTYVVATGGGQLAAPTAPATDAQGVAISGTWTLGPNAGTQTVTASAAGAGSVTFTATAQ